MISLLLISAATFTLRFPLLSVLFLRERQLSKLPLAASLHVSLILEHIYSSHALPAPAPGLHFTWV